MKNPQCRLTLADRFFLGSGGGSVAKAPSVAQTVGGATQAFKKQVLPLYRNQWLPNEPLLQAGQQFALTQGPQFEQRLANLPEIQPDLTQTWQNQIAPVLTSGGELTPEQHYRAQQEAFGNAAMQGNVYGNQANIADVLNQQKYKDVRFQQAQQAAGVISGLQGQDIAQRTGLASAIQQGYIAPEQAQVGSMATLMAPVYGLAGQQLAAQSNADIARAQQASAGKAGTSSLVGAGIGLAGSAAIAI